MSETPVPGKDPLKGFRGISAGVLIIEAVVVALALPVVAKLGGGIGTGTGFLVLGLLVALLVTCGLLRFPWSTYVIVGLHVVMVASWLAMTALGGIGVVFSLVWFCLFWLRRDLAKRMAQGRLPSQQSP